MKNNHKAIVFLAISALSLQANHHFNSAGEAVAHITSFLTDEDYRVTAHFKDMCLQLAEQLKQSNDDILKALGETLVGIAYERSEVKIIKAVKGYHALFTKKGHRILDLAALRQRLAAALAYRS